MDSRHRCVAVRRRQPQKGNYERKAKAPRTRDSRGLASSSRAVGEPDAVRRLGPAGAVEPPLMTSPRGPFDDGLHPSHPSSGRDPGPCIAVIRAVSTPAFVPHVRAGNPAFCATSSRSGEPDLWTPPARRTGPSVRTAFPLWRTRGSGLPFRPGEPDLSGHPSDLANQIFWASSDPANRTCGRFLLGALCPKAQLLGGNRCAVVDGLCLVGKRQESKGFRKVKFLPQSVHRLLHNSTCGNAAHAQGCA